MSKLWDPYVAFWERKLNFVYPKRLSDVTSRSFFKRCIVNYLLLQIAIVVVLTVYYMNRGSGDVLRNVFETMIDGFLLLLAIDTAGVLIAKLWAWKKRR